MFETFSVSVVNNVTKVLETCYRNDHIAFLFITLKTSSTYTTDPIIYFPFQTKLNGIVINIPASSVGQYLLANEFVYGYIGQDRIVATTTKPSLWLYLSLVLHI